jgi:3-hydroxyisobutyrate dehydrogenase-like beta-hydroxyacid dehydrogenase
MVRAVARSPVQQATPISADRVGRVGVIGLGRMGLPICARLVERGFDVSCTDLDRTRVQLGAGTGAVAVDDAAAAAAGADVVVTVLPGPGEVADVSGAVTAAMPAGSLWLELSTASPATARITAAAAAQAQAQAQAQAEVQAEVHEIAVVDAPLGGGPPAASEGRLLSFVGAREADLPRVREVLGAVADRTVHVGPPGSGYAVKLMANSLWFGQAVATAEALAIAARAGLDPEQVRDALAQSAAASRFLADDARALLDGDDMPWFGLARCAEQLRSLTAFADELSVPAQMLGTVSQIHEAALERYGDVDGELLGARLTAERAGVSFGDPDGRSP